MDALRKAEQQKQKLATQGAGAGTGAEAADAQPLPGLALEPFSLDAPADAAEPALAFPAGPETENTFSPGSLLGRSSRSRLPELPTRLEDLDEQFMAHAAESSMRKPSPPVAPAPVTDARPPASPAPATPDPPAPPVKPSAPAAAENKLEPSPESARKLFEVKQPQQKNRRKSAMAIGLVALLVGGGIGAYVWWELQPKGSMIGGNLAKAPAPIAPPPVAAPAEPAPPAPTPVAPAPAMPPAEVVAAAVPPASTSVPAEKTGDDEDEKPRATTAKRKPAPAAVTAPAVPLPESPVRVSSTTRKQDPALDLAYQAFNQGEFDLAQANWKKVLAKDPRNADALHGMATLALQNRKNDLAAEYYSRALENDPKDARALAGLLSLKAPADSMQAESRLKLLLAEQADSPYLNFALGNLFARDARWAEAQQAYFKAHTADPANPDYLFNLAVSLDQLHQPRLAAQYYSQALAAAAQQPAGFDAIQVATRLKALQSSLQQ